MADAVQIYKMELDVMLNRPITQTSHARIMCGTTRFLTYYGFAGTLTFKTIRTIVDADDPMHVHLIATAIDHDHSDTAWLTEQFEDIHYLDRIAMKLISDNDTHIARIASCVLKAKKPLTSDAIIVKLDRPHQCSAADIVDYF